MSLSSYDLYKVRGNGTFKDLNKVKSKLNLWTDFQGTSRCSAITEWESHLTKIKKPFYVARCIHKKKKVICYCILVENEIN